MKYGVSHNRIHYIYGAFTILKPIIEADRVVTELLLLYTSIESTIDLMTKKCDIF